MKISFFVFLLLLSSIAYSQTRYYVYHDMEKDTISLEESVVYGSLSATNDTPFSFNNITKSTLEIFPGAEAAYAISTTPSITFYGDNGTNLGYVYYRLRGIDQNRLNVTLNGVPLNEPEDQGSYFNNFPNFLSAIGDIQIIRGAGLSKVGTATFGGSLNFETKNAGDKDFAEASLSYGSNFTKMFQTSVSSNGFFIGVSNFSTDGYKYHSGNSSNSTNYGADFKLFGQKMKWFGMIGRQENGMSWTGETLDLININSRYNTNKIGERDNFFNTHNQLTFENTSIRNSKITYTLFHQYQSGWYDTDISLFDPSLTEGELMSRIKLDFNWLGAIYNQSYTYKNIKINIGANYNVEHRNHEGLDNYQKEGFLTTYTNTGIKQEFSQYLKGEYVVNNLSFYVDIQHRYINYKYESPTYNFDLYNKSNINYSAGISYKEGNSIFHYGFGKTSREPRRSDILGGIDNYAGGLNKLYDETVRSQDIGYKYINDNLQISANYYKMNFVNEFMPTGEYGNNGITLYKNVTKSYREGIEFSCEYRMNGTVISGNLTLSDNKFISNDLASTNPDVFMKWYKSILSPSRIANINITQRMGEFIYVGINARTNSKSYIDLTNSYTLPSHTVIDGYIGVKDKTMELRLNMNNLTNSLILTNGVIGFDGNPRYFVMNKFASLLTLKITI